MTQPAFAVVCDNCLESSGDWRAVGELWICGTCWDPFGTLVEQCLSRSQVEVLEIGGVQ